MTMTQINQPPFYMVDGYKLFAPIEISENTLNLNEVKLDYHCVNDDLSIGVRFKTFVGLHCEWIDEFGISGDDAAQMMIECATDRICDLGIPREALLDVRLHNTSIDSWVEIDCIFFFEPEEIQCIDPRVEKMVRFDFVFYSAEATLQNVLSACLPEQYAADHNAGVEEIISSFAGYLRTALPWEMQWLLKYDSYVAHLIQGDDVVFQYQFIELSEFTYSSDYNLSAALSPIFTFRLHPAIPVTPG